MPFHFNSQNTLFVNNISKYDVFDINFNGDEYDIGIDPKNEEDLREICDILAKYADNWSELDEVTMYFLDEGNLHDYFERMLGREKGGQIVDDAVEYTKSLFEK